MFFAGKDTFFSKRSSPPHPISQKLSRGIAFIVADKNNSGFFEFSQNISNPPFLKQSS